MKPEEFAGAGALPSSSRRTFLKASVTAGGALLLGFRLRGDDGDLAALVDRHEHVRIGDDAAGHRRGAGLVVLVHLGERARREQLHRDDEPADAGEELAAADVFNESFHGYAPVIADLTAAVMR